MTVPQPSAPPWQVPRAGDLRRRLIGRSGWIAAAASAGAITAAFVSTAIPPTYRAEERLELSGIAVMASVADVATSESVARTTAGEPAASAAGMTPGTARRSTSAVVAGNAITVAFRDSDRRRALALVRSVARSTARITAVDGRAVVVPVGRPVVVAEGQAPGEAALIGGLATLAVASAAVTVTGLRRPRLTSVAGMRRALAGRRPPGRTGEVNARRPPRADVAE